MNALSKIGAWIFPWGKKPPSPEEVLNWAVFAEELGFDSVNMPWHYTLPNTRTFADFGNKHLLDPLVLFPALAVRTKKIRLGFHSMVAPVAHPFAWAQYFASLDVLSGGRTVPGLALGWWPQDFQVGGVSSTERGRRTDEHLAMIRDLWAGRPITEPGRFYDGTGLVVEPLPVQNPMPIWLGGGMKSVDRAARWCTGLFPGHPTIEELTTSIRPEMDAASSRHNAPRLDLAIITDVYVSDNRKWLEDFVRPRLLARRNALSLTEVLNSPPGRDLNQPDGHVIWGSGEDCAEQITELLRNGADYIVGDFNFHGLEDIEFAKARMSDFVEKVVPHLGSLAKS